MHFVENKRMFQQIGRFNFKNAGEVIKSDTSICILPNVLNVFDKTPVFYIKNYTSFFSPKHEKLECVIFICKIQHFQTKHKKHVFYNKTYVCWFSVEFHAGNKQQDQHCPFFVPLVSAITWGLLHTSNLPLKEMI